MRRFVFCPVLHFISVVRKLSTISVETFSRHAPNKPRSGPKDAGIAVKTKKSAPSHNSFRRFHFWQKASSAVLLICLSATSLFAAPESTRTLVVLADGIGQDIRFDYLSSTPGTILGRHINGFLALLRVKKQTSQISRIEIRPGSDLTVRQGEPINFSAIAYTVNNRPIHGLKFDWSVQDVGRQRAAHNLPDGTFPAKIPGTFVITARTEG